MARARDLARIGEALDRAREVLSEFTPGQVNPRFKNGDDPVTEADLRIDAVLRESLPAPGDGWLSEESADDARRLACRRVWIVDPVDGTREFVAGVPEWCVSVALVEGGRAVAGGICNPETGETVIGAVDAGVTLNGSSCHVLEARQLEGCEVLASRSETARGEWRQYSAAPFRVRPTGSVAYKLALVAAGKAHATWTVRPKHEWDVAAGAALVEAAGGRVCSPDGAALRFNRSDPRLSGIVAAAAPLTDSILELLRGQPESARRATNASA